MIRDCDCDWNWDWDWSINRVDMVTTDTILTLNVFSIIGIGIGLSIWNISITTIKKTRIIIQIMIRTIKSK